MKTTAKQKLPRGWNEKKVQAVIEHYDRQTAEEAAAEIESAPDATGETWISVPIELLPAVTRLIKRHQKDDVGRGRNGSKKSRATRART